MLFHEALHLVFVTFSRQVLQQGRLTNYLADCGVFDTFDDRRTICLTIDHRYGARLYACLSHSPYKEQFDAILTEVKQLHPTIDPQQVDYVFQSIRYAWGKIKSVRPPKPPIIFAPPTKKRQRRTTPASSPYTLHPRHKRRPSHIVRGASNRAATRPIAQRPPSSPSRARVRGQFTTPAPLTPAQRHKRNARVVLYLASLIFIFCSCVLFNINHGAMGTFCLLSAGICIYVIYKYLKWPYP